MAEPIDRPAPAIALAPPPVEPHPATFAGGLLHYRAWPGTLRTGTETGPLVFLAVQAVLLALMAASSAWPAVRLLLAGAFLALFGLLARSRAWPIARVALVMIFRRRLFWALYGLALMVFLLFFFGQYLMAWATTQLGTQDVRIGGFTRVNPKFLVGLFRDALKLNGSGETFRNFFHYEAYMVMVVLALAGSIVIGNDLRFGSLPFYLAKPISRWDYLLGKALAVAVFVNLMTTLPAALLFVQFGLLEEWDYFFDQAHLLVGILGYGLILTATLTLLLLATATWLRKTVPLVMTWTTLFFFCRLLAAALVDGLHFDARWRLIDLWNNTYLLGNACLGIDLHGLRPASQPAWYEAALVLSGVCLSCLTYLIWRIRAVEIVQ
jgi:ABC-type transport system involved in multi-copper enzyme maturation permease subunit